MGVVEGRDHCIGLIAPFKKVKLENGRFFSHLKLFKMAGVFLVSKNDMD